MTARQKTIKYAWLMPLIMACQLGFCQSSGICQEVSSTGSLFNLPAQKVKSNKSVFDFMKPDNRVIKGRVEIPTIEARWSKNHRLGVKALRQHQYDLAEELLSKAIKEAKRKLSKRSELIETRVVLARLFLRQERFQEAHQIYDSNFKRIISTFGPESDQAIETHIGLARCLLSFGKDKAAMDHAKDAIKVLEKKGKTDSKLYGYALQTLALIDADNAWFEDAKPLFNLALSIFQKEPGYNNLDLANILREQALYHHSRGERAISRKLYEESYSIKEKVVAVNQPTSKQGQVRFAWEPGSTRSKEIIDTEFPFRYLRAGDVRVAATVIDLWELLGVLITVTNVSDHQQEFDLGKVTLFQLTNRRGKTFHHVIKPVDPKSIDRIRRERVMWDLTHTRPWLANIQKTRTVRGLVPANGHDLFRGPNVFGVYGDWKAVSHIVPARVSTMSSREGLHSRIVPGTVKLPGMLRGGSQSVKGFVPVFLEPLESRTGDIFYLNPRDKDIVIKIPVGNAIFEIPFHTRKIKIP